MQSSQTISIPADESREVKLVIRDRWNVPARVEGWISSGLNVEFEEPVCRAAWRQALRRAANGAQPRDALDIGTGPGTIAQLWAELGCTVTGVDISPAMLDAGRRRAAERGLTIRFLEGDAEAPPLSAERFDAISSRFVLYTLPHPGYALRRWVSLLRPGGTLALIGHDRAETRDDSVRPHGPGHGQDERHREALSRLPFMHHKSADLVVLMEAVGLRDIQRVPLDEVIAVRAALRHPPSNGAPEAAPFLLAGHL